MDEYFEEQFVQLAKEANAKIGISWAFSGKEHVKRHYKQAVFSLETARALRLPGHIFTYDDTYIYALIRGCTKQDYWAANEHPVLTCLRDYDTAHDSSLYDTLYCLLKCGMNSSLAATKMGIHKSTLFHRIEVLNELIPGIMTKNTDWQASVMLSFDLTQLKNKQ